MIRKGYLSSYVKKGQASGTVADGGSARVINVIHRAKYQGDDRALRRDIKHLKPLSLNPPAVMAIAQPKDTVTFSEEDLQGIVTPHNDALVMQLSIGEYLIRRILIDTGSEINVLYFGTLERWSSLNQWSSPPTGQ